MGAASTASFVLRAPAAASDALTVCPSHPAELTVTPSSLVLSKGAIAEGTVPPPHLPLLPSTLLLPLHVSRAVIDSHSSLLITAYQATLLPQHSGKRMFLVNVLSGSNLCMVPPPSSSTPCTPAIPRRQHVHQVYALHASVSDPVINKTYAISSTVGRPLSKKIIYTNPFGSARRFKLRCTQVHPPPPRSSCKVLTSASSATGRVT